MFFSNYNKGAKYCSLAPPFSMTQWFDGLKLSRHEIVLLNRIRSAHTLTRWHLFPKNFNVDPYCECGGNYHSTDHIFWECEKYETGRVRLHSTASKHYDNPENIVKLAFSDVKEARDAILNFLKSNNINI